MKKLLFALVALFATLSINAQVIEIYDNNVLAKVYTNSNSHKYKAIFKEKSQAPTFTFSVSAEKKVKFTKGNLWWDGEKYRLEEKQTDYPKSWDASHVGHFFWYTKAIDDYGLYHPYGTNGVSPTTYNSGDKIWCNEENKISADGIKNLYALSFAEWNYLRNTRDDAADKYKLDVTVDGVKCVVIAPDEYEETLSTMTALTLEDAELKGLVCIPYAGYRENTTVRTYEWPYYWSSSLQNWGSQPYAYEFNGNASKTQYGLALRLVQNVGDEGSEDDPGESDPIETDDYITIGGVKWAKKNLGATSVGGSPAQCVGDFYQWGAQETCYSSVSWNGNTPSFTMKSGYDLINDYCREELSAWSKFPDMYDIVQKKLGDGYRMPTVSDFQKLLVACKGSLQNSYDMTKLITNPTVGGIYWLAADQTFLPDYSGTAGILCVELNTLRKLFFPCTGVINNNSQTGNFYDFPTVGYYWTSSAYSSLKAVNMYFTIEGSYGPKISNPGSGQSIERNRGIAIRPVKD